MPLINGIVKQSIIKEAELTKRKHNHSDAVRWSIKWKLIAVMTVLMIALVSILSYIQISSQKRMLETELNHRIALMKDNLVERGRNVIQNLSRQVENDIASFNFSRAIEVIKESVRNNKEIKFAVLTDASGIVYIHTARPDLTQTKMSSIRDVTALKQEDTTAIAYQEGNESVIEMVNPLWVSTKTWGVLRLIYTLQPLHNEIENSNREIQQEIHHMIYKSVLTSAGFMGICFVIVFILASRLSKPLINLTESARRISKGDFSASAGVRIRSMDEVGLLAQTFFQMSKDLETSYGQLEEYSKRLEEKVERRTREMKLALKETAEARDRIDGILKSVADGLMVTDLHNRVILMNRAAEALLGVRFSEVVHQPIDFAVAEHSLREKIRETLDKKSTGLFFDFHLPDVDPKHSRVMRARTSVMYDREGNETGIVTIIHDVTHEREVDRMKTEFISTAAHEFRSPLTSILGFSNILLTREDLSLEEKKKFLSYIHKQSVAMTHIIDDLLDISRIESGSGFTLKRAPYNSSRSVQNVISYFREQYKTYRFETVLLEKPFKLNADKEKMEQVLKNLLSNAVKYSPDGGNIQVSEGLSQNAYQVIVTDRGAGMSKDQAEKIFDKFFRADASDKGVEGTGLGMTIVKHIVEAHGGEIEVKSTLGKGTSVKYTIPVETKGAIKKEARK